MRKVFTVLIIANTVSTAAMLLSPRFRNWFTPLITAGAVTGDELADFYGLPK